MARSKTRLTFHLQIECENAAFEDCPHEVARILREAAAKVGEERRALRGETKLRDVNGNTVGFFEYRDD